MIWEWKRQEKEDGTTIDTGGKPANILTDPEDVAMAVTTFFNFNHDPQIHDVKVTRTKQLTTIFIHDKDNIGKCMASDDPLFPKRIIEGVKQYYNHIEYGLVDIFKDEALELSVSVQEEKRAMLNKIYNQLVPNHKRRHGT